MRTREPARPTTFTKPKGARPLFVYKMGTPLGSGLLGATTFCARQHGADECDAKGLPLTLNSTIIIGRFERLKELYHPNLPVYLDARKLKNGVYIYKLWTAILYIPITLCT